MTPIWLRGQDSNLRPHGYEPCELPLLHPAVSNEAPILYQSGVALSMIGFSLLHPAIAVQEEIEPCLHVALVKRHIAAIFGSGRGYRFRLDCLHAFDV